MTRRIRRWSQLSQGNARVLTNDRHVPLARQPSNENIAFDDELR
jgi:hypothetical protein